MTPPDPSTRLLVQATVESLQAEVRELRGRLAVAEKAVDAAVKAERAECARLVEEDVEVSQYTFAGTTYDDGTRTLMDAAAAIRARSER